MELREAVDRLRYELYRAEGFSDHDLKFLPPPPGTREYARYLDHLGELAEKRTPEVARGFRRALDRSLRLFARAVPKHPPSPLSAQVVDFIPDIGRLVEDMAEPFFRADERLFRKLRERITDNTDRAGKLRPSKLAAYSEPRRVVETYFAGTPLLDLFLAEIPMPFPTENRYAGHWILARPNAGKTQALSYLIEHDLPLVAEGKASIIIMDSQGNNTPGKDGKPPTLLYTVSHLKLFAPGQPLDGRLIYIDPADDPTIPFNLFDLGLPGSPEARFAGTKKLLEFVFTALLGEPFSPQMEMLFAHALRLMLAIPGAQLADLRRLLIKGGMDRYARKIAELDEETHQFFTEQFGKSNLEVTKSAVLNRLSALSNVPAFKRLVSHPRTELNLFDEIERGRVIVIDTNAGELEDGTAVIGRFFLAMLGAVSRRRIKIEERRKTPCFVYIDELADYCSGSANQLGEILATCRKQNIAICAANQRLSQIPDLTVRDALKATDIKFANPLAEDANTIAINMGETPAKALTNRAAGSFAAHIRGMRRAVSIRIPYPNLSAQEMLTDAEYRRMRDDIRAAYAREPQKPRPAAPPDSPRPRPEADRRADDPEDHDAPHEFAG